MASLFQGGWQDLDLLDAGAGEGALSAAVVRSICESPQGIKRIRITAYEVDSSLIERLSATLKRCEILCEDAGIPFSATIFNEDFIASMAPSIQGDLFISPQPKFNVAIVNPPYRKISSHSATRHSLRLAGIETSNLYTGFVSLIVKLLRPGGELVAITPRSFCNGPYFKVFRKDFLKAMSLRRVHVFGSRSAAFQADKVLQENVIVHAVKDRVAPNRVVVSSSSGEEGGKVTERAIHYESVVSPDDPDRFIHLDLDERYDRAGRAIQKLQASLAELGLSVSTGRVVEFRATAFLRDEPGRDTVPLVYPGHFQEGIVHWPQEKFRKPNAILWNKSTHDLLIPSGLYVLVKRFSSKEERRRIVACIYDPPKDAPPFVGFENHLNYFHAEGEPLTRDLAKGLVAFLNSTVLDSHFRRFSGHTQVNAADLRRLRYPSVAVLERLGRKVRDLGMPQQELDALVEKAVF